MKLKAVLEKKTWSPYACGAVLGVVAAASLALAHERLGATGAFGTLTSLVVHALGLEKVFGVYFTAVKPPVFDPDLLLAAGMLAGAFLAARLSGDCKVRKIPEEGWTQRFGPSVAKRWVFVFVGCMLMAIGAGIAGGCTSGMGVSGTMQLSPAGLAFILGCFTVGLAAAAILFRNR